MKKVRSATLKIELYLKLLLNPFKRKNFEERSNDQHFLTIINNIKHQGNANYIVIRIPGFLSTSRIKTVKSVNGQQIYGCFPIFSFLLSQLRNLDLDIIDKP